MHFICRPCEIHNNDPNDVPGPDDEQVNIVPDPELNDADVDPLDSTFDIQHRDADDVAEPINTSLSTQIDLPDDIIADESEIEYKVLEKGSKRGGRLLIASNGYTFGVKRVNKTSIIWTCSVRSTKIRCHATVNQQGDQFSASMQNHNHAADPKLPMYKEIVSKVKQKISDQPQFLAMEVVTTILTEDIPTDLRFLAPKQKQLKRTENKHRATTRPSEPTDLDFVLDVNFLKCEEFLVADLRVDRARHLVFATPFQLNMLKHANRWFMDGTFKVVKEPFKKSGQLVSIHAFILKDGKHKQLPLAFALMSRKTEEDYVAILQALKDCLDEPVVAHFVLDFEIGAWQAIRRVFPGVNIKGCVFHWTQAVWRHVQSYGLSTAYRRQEAVHKYIRQLLALPFLPAGHIVDTFNVLKQRATTEQLRQLVDYIDRQWFQNAVIAVSDWCVFRNTVRTNNDVEGWHNRLNTAARHGGVPFYVLIPELKKEAAVVDLSVRSDDLERNINQKFTKLETKIQTAWDKYMDNAMTTTHFLSYVARLYKPTDKPNDDAPADE